MSVEKKKMSIVTKMMISVFGGMICGVLLILLRQALLSGGAENIWDLIHKLLFADVTADTGFHSIGLFYIVGQLFMHGLQLAIVPLVLVSLSLAICSLADPERLGKIAGRTFACYICFYVVCAALACCAAYFVKSMGWFNVNLPADIATDTVATMEGYNVLSTVVNAVPSNITAVFSTNTSILAVCVVAVIVGLCMTRLPEKTAPLKAVIESVNEIVLYYLNFLINKCSPVAIFCMITRAFAVYGVEYIGPTLVWMLSTIAISLILVCTVYPIGIFVSTGLNPIPFIKKSFKIGLFAAATNSSAATLPLNTETCINELGCSEEISSFVLPTGMTINMNGTTAMHMMAVTFIATAAGINVTPANLALAAFLSICTAMGTPAIPVAGTTMVYVVLMGLGFNSDLCMVGYALVLAMNYLPGMAVITLNVIGDAATNVIVNFKEGVLNKDKYNS